MQRRKAVRFISHSPAFMIQIVPERVHFSPYGDRLIDREGFVAKFNQNDINEGDVEFAERVFVPEGLNGRQTLIDEVTLAPLLARLSVFDTDEEAKREGWQGQTLEDSTGIYDKKEYVESFLAKHAEGHGDFRLVEVASMEPPWPRYLDYQGTPDELLAKLESEGHDLRRVLVFERQLGKRPRMIEMLEERLGERERAEQGSLVVPA